MQGNRISTIHSEMAATERKQRMVCKTSSSPVQFMALECFKFIVTYSVASYYPETLLLYAIWLLKVAREYVLMDSNTKMTNGNRSCFRKVVCQTTSKEIDFEGENTRKEKLFESKSPQRTSGCEMRGFETNCDKDFVSFSRYFKDTELLSIPLNDLENQSVEEEKKKKKKLNIVSHPAESEECIENEIKKPKEHDWVEFRSDYQLEKIVEIVAYQILLTFMVQNEKSITTALRVTSTNQKMANNINNPPNDGNDKCSKKNECGRKQNSERTVSQNSKSKCCQTRTGSAGIGGNSGSNGDDEDDENRQPKKWNTCNTDYCLIVEEEEEQEPKPALSATVATDINNAGEQQEKIDEECQTLTSEQLSYSGKAVVSSDSVKPSFHCKQNTCNISAWKGCKDPHCQEFYNLITHSHCCEQRIVDGCQKCFSFAQYLHDHAKGCKDEDCPVDRCQIIKARRPVLESFSAQTWNSTLENIFFNPVPPQFHPSQCPPVDINSLYPDLKLEKSDEEVVSHYKQKRDQEVRKWKPLECNQPVTTEHSAEFEDVELGSSNYLHETEELSCSAKVDQPPPDPLYDVGFCSTPMSSSSPVGTGVRNIVRLHDNQDIPLIEENIKEKEDRRKTQIDMKHPIAVIEVTLPSPGKLEMEVPLGLASNTTADDRQQKTSEQVLHSQRQKDGDDQTVLWHLNPAHLSVVDGRYDEYNHWFTSPDQYLSGGANSRCFIGTDRQTGKQFAIKRIPLEKFDIMELQNWGKLSGGPNIVELYGAIKKGKEVIIFMELMEGGSLEDVIADQEDSGYGGSETSSDGSSLMLGSLPEGVAMYIIGEVLKALRYMHSKKIMHRDIKGANILLDETYQIVKVGDFGEAVDLTNRECQQENAPRGTEAFMAPEVCRSEDHSFSADIWSLMCTLYQMLTGQPPWMEFRHNSILYMIGTAQSPPELPDCSPQIEDFFERGFKLNSRERETAVELLKHPALQLGNVFTGASLSGEETSNCGTGYSSEQELCDFSSKDQSGSEEGKVSSQAMRTSTPASLEEQLDLLSLDPLPIVASRENKDFLLSDLEDTNGAGSPPLNPNVAPTDWTSFSITDLTKIHVVSPTGVEIFTVRESSTVSYEALAEILREKVASETGLKTFKLVDLDGTPLVGVASLGCQEQWLKIQSSP